MGYLLHIVLAVIAQACVESGLDTGITWWPGVVLLLLAPYALARVTRRLYMRGRFRVAGSLLGLLGHSPVLLHLLALALFGWLRSVEAWTGVPGDLSSWPHPTTLLGFAPFTLYALAAIDARARLTASVRGQAARTRRFQGRMFVSGLLPLALYVLITWVLGWSPALRAHIEHAAVWSALFASFMLLGMVLLLPRILRDTWDTVPLPAGPMREQLEGLARRAGVRFRELLVWRTGHQMANAAVVGVTRHQRIVLLSDELLARLEPRELQAVFAHELGHVRRHHVAFFLAWALVFLLGADLVATWLELADPLHAGGLLIAGLLPGYLAFGYLSRRFELEADLYSAELLGGPDDIVRALESVGGTHGRRLGSWRHFSTADRVAFLQRTTAEPHLAARLKRTLRKWSIAGLVGAVLVVALQVRELAKQYRHDRVVVALSLGRYADAARHLLRLEAREPELERVVEDVSALAGPDGSVPMSGLEERAERALRQGEAQVAVEFLRLAALRGRSGLDVAADAVAAAVDPTLAAPSAPQVRRLRQREPRWTSILEELGLL